MRTAVFAHRGSKANRPENTLPSFEEAMRVGSDGIELDVHLTKDQKVVVMHDEKIDRTTNGKGQIKTYTLDQLKQFDAGSWFSAKYKGEQVPTLVQVLELLSDYPGVLNIEFKTDRNVYPGIEARVAQLVDRYRANLPVVYSSFNHESLIRMKKIDPNAELALLLWERLADPWRYTQQVGATAQHLWQPSALSETAVQLHEHGIKVRAWTVNKPKLMQLSFEMGLDAIITDYPEVAIDLRKSYEKAKK
ncbi:glycerophosphodiester phosphodiesterase [Sporolactobacillus laevolacticus]|uniref:Glycerophosphoryl diester phosphodiesterase n=1 Tax=Sporolactobacillus laevolacticus DSM 442 TaxID=1395513 RepID=V6IXZ5_9BACL|nr:glycerophosphodiester phosphodiesterase [Sporolactobacillus laevolacticus]EST12308.1 glycerophosphoryl diester phosphodiesterase [Sporolactobacillus laevolacticus DSM 442]